MEEKEEVMVVSEILLQDKIYNVRGRKVMLNVDLAEIYGYETKNFNRQVRNNLQKFEGDDFMFQLSDEEVEELSRCKNCTLNKGIGRGKNVKYNPYVFTEQGIYMLMTVLRGELATKQSRALVRTFKKMKDYIIDNRELIGQRDYATDDERIFLCGSSSKDAGARVTSIVEDFGVEKYRVLVNNLQKNAELILS